jgi:hypothetical protein
MYDKWFFVLGKKNELFMWAQKQKDPLEWRA